MFFFNDPDYHDDVREALRECQREDLIGNGPQCLVPQERGKRGASHYPGKPPPHLRDKTQKAPWGAPNKGRADDGWGPNASKKKRYEEDHGTPSGGPGCGSGSGSRQTQKVMPDGEGGALEWLA